MKEKKSGRGSKFLIFILFLLSISCIACGVVLQMTSPVGSGNSTEKTKKSVKVNGPKEISSIMTAFLKYIPVDGSNAFETAANRKLYISLELESIKKETADAGQPVGYVDYDVYAAKYEEIFGDNYSLVEDLKVSSVGGPDTELCKNYPSIAEQNVICWSSNLGVVAGELSFKVSGTNQLNNRYIMDGTFDKTYPDGGSEKGTFKMIYTIKGSKTYLKSMVLTKNTTTSE